MCSGNRYSFAIVRSFLEGVKVTSSSQKWNDKIERTGGIERARKENTGIMQTPIFLIKTLLCTKGKEKETPNVHEKRERDR